MVIHNATFMVRKELEGAVISWLKHEIEGVAGEGCNPRVSAMREAGGVSHEHAEAASVAFQMEFPDADAARKWGESVFSVIADRFTNRFGEESMVFTSLFEVV